ncbi:MAG: sulfate adenylyltransferase subunit 2 [Sediminibacterium sp.]|nr:sulfate adenylyltransferase subunit 2 [Sediminibacterium sp.]
MNYLEELEAESIYIFRETLAQFSKPALLFSGGKDSITLLHLAIKSYYPLKLPFPLVHIDTGHNFPEVIEYRDKMVKKYNVALIVRKVEDTIIKRKLTELKGEFASRNSYQSYTLLDTIQEFEFDACIGGGRRDEEKARAKERIFSFRDDFGQWNPKLQRPELWNILNGKINKGENIRVFPISNWTELDVWSYIEKEKITLPSIYYAHERKVINYNNQWIAVSPFIKIDPNIDNIEIKNVRYRTVGDMTCTAAVLSNAINNSEVVLEIKNSKISERGETRMDDNLTEAAMEERKSMGYF